MRRLPVIGVAFLMACSAPDREPLFGPSGGVLPEGGVLPGGGAAPGPLPSPAAPAEGPSSSGAASEAPITPAEGHPTLTPPTEASAPSESSATGEPPLDESQPEPGQPAPPANEGEPTGSDALTPPAEEEPIGWASVAADGQLGTFGGRGGEVVLVDTPGALRAALEGPEPRIVRVTASFDAGEVEAGSNKTLEGAPGVVLRLGLDIDGQHNVIVRDLTLRGYGCPAGDDACEDGDDVVEISDSHHVWVHHVDIADGADGNLDIVRGASYVTVSWSKFSYQSADSEHRFSNLVGADDDEDADIGRLDVTWHDNWWADNVDQGMPRTRRGRIHVFNNLYTAAGNSYCTNAGFEASVLVESNLYIGVNRPLAVDDGDMLARGNLFVDSETPEATQGVGFVPPYPYPIVDAVVLEQVVRAGAGPRSGR